MTVGGEEQQQTTEPAEPTEAVEPTEEQEALEEPTLKRPYNEILEDVSGTFIDCLKPSKELLRYLAQHQVLSPEMSQKVTCRPYRAEKVCTLLGFLKTLGPQSFLCFVDALRHTEQMYLANILAANVIQPSTSD